MGSIIGHRIDYIGVGVLSGQWHIPSKNDPSTLWVYKFYKCLPFCVMLSKMVLKLPLIRRYEHLADLIVVLFKIINNTSNTASVSYVLLSPLAREPEAGQTIDLYSFAETVTCQLSISF